MSTGLHPVPPDFAASARLKAADYRRLYAESVSDPEGFWAEQAELIEEAGRWADRLSVNVELPRQQVGERPVVELHERPVVGVNTFAVDGETPIPLLELDATVAETPPPSSAPRSSVTRTKAVRRSRSNQRRPGSPIGHRMRSMLDWS